MEERSQDARFRWTVYAVFGIVWLATELVLRNMERIDDEPFRSQGMFFNAVMVTAIVSAISDLWRRYVRANYVGFTLAAIGTFALRIWLFNFYAAGVP